MPKSPTSATSASRKRSVQFQTPTWETPTPSKKSPSSAATMTPKKSTLTSSGKRSGTGAGEKQSYAVLLPVVLSALIIPTIVGMLSVAWAGMPKENTWYQQLQKPPWQPPDWAFPLAWGILYALLGVVLCYIVLMPSGTQKWWIGTLFALQMVLNYFWSPMFFQFHEVLASLLILLTMVVVVAILGVLMWRAQKKMAACLLIPYILWLSFASTLNIYIQVKN